jgi:hypothetical protein
MTRLGALFRLLPCLPVLFSAIASAQTATEEMAKAAILAKLKDPDSAKFADIAVKGEFVCGRVNAKTAQGGYAGPKYWVFESGGKKAIIERGGDISIDPIDSMVRPKEDLCK